MLGRPHESRPGIPEAWQEMPLRQVVAEMGDGGTPPRSEPSYFGGQIPWIVITDIDRHISRTEEQLTDAGLSACSAKLWPEGAVILSTGATVGNVGITRVPAATKQGITGIVTKKERLQPEFLAAVLSASRAILRSLAQGSTIQEIRPPALGTLQILLPPLREQQKIATILSSVDDAIAATRKVIVQTKRVKQGLLRTLMTRGIGHSRFKKTEMGEIPEAWQVVPLRALARKITDGTHQPVETIANGPVPFLYVSCIRDGRIAIDSAASVSEETYVEISPGREAFPGLVLYTAVGSYGHAAVVQDKRRLAFQRHIAYIAPDVNEVLSGYLANFLNSDRGRREADRLAVGNAQKTVTLRDLRKFRIPLPPLKEQAEILVALQAIQQEEELCRAQVAGLEKTKRGLLQDLLTGRVRVQPD